MISRREFLLHSAAAGAGLAAAPNLAIAVEPKTALALAGTDAPGSTFYTRMFPKLPRQGAGNSRLEEGLIKLAEQMEETVNRAPEGKAFPPIAGYTYLGQFIDHDLTFDLTSLDDAGEVDVEQIPNFRTPFLDLDNLYGGGPNLSPFLYQIKDEYRRAERFLIGKTITRDGRDGPNNDLPRNAEGIALAGDPRQDENLILAQLHVAFLKLHNKVLELNKGAELKKSPYYEQAGSPFAAAQRLVRWHYQWIVRHDFLEKVLDPTVFAALENGEKTFSNSRRSFQIPIEFSAAAFRFGHSMVRNHYHIQEKHMGVELADVLQQTGPGGGARPRLPEDWTIDWRFFFFPSGGTGSAQNSSMIDTRISSGLYKLSAKTEKLFNVPMPKEELRLPVRTLLRGARMGLPSGQKIAEKFESTPLREDQIATGPEAPVLNDYGFVEDTPLWYYILKEAEVLGKGARLGPSGSKLIADVIVKALTMDPNSYPSVSKNCEWVPTLPLNRPKTEPETFDMSDLIHFVTHQT